MEKIIIITTGGTIAMKENKRSNEIKNSGENPIEKMIKSYIKNQEIGFDNFINVPSPNITPEIIFNLTEKIFYYLNRENVKGLIVTHGTDTLEETSYFVDLTVIGNKPIVFTGAMRSVNELGTDGPSNVLNSLKVVNDEAAKGKGVLVVFNEEIHSARYVTKTHTSNISTFKSPQTGPIGVINKNRVYFFSTPLPEEKYLLKQPSKKVGLIKVAVGIDDLLINSYIENGYDGIIIEAFGQGNLPPAMINGIKRAIEKGVKIGIVSRCDSGLINPVYSYEGGGKHLKDLGVIFYEDLTGQKARIKMIVQLNQ